MLSGVMTQFMLGIFSVFMVVAGAELAVAKMQAVAKYYSVSEVVVAVTLISIGTSLPEIVLHTVGSFNILAEPEVMNGVSSTVIGMSIGSDIVQQTLIMGGVIVTASFIGAREKIVFTRKFVKRSYIPMIAAHILVFIFALNRGLSRLEGVLLLAVFAAYMYYLYRTRGQKLLRHGDANPSKNPRKDILIGVSSLLTLVFFSDVFLGLVENIISNTGISGSMIGVAVVGFVSAMPEFVTAISAIKQGAEGISLGTLIGSNVTNPLMAIGLGSAISGYSVPDPLVLWDLPVQIFTALVLVFYLWNRQRIGHLISIPFQAIGLEKTAEKLDSMENGVLTAIGGILLIGLYIFYLAMRVRFFSLDFT